MVDLMAQLSALTVRIAEELNERSGGPRKYTTQVNLSAGSERVVTHNLGTQTLVASVVIDGRDTAVDWRVINDNTIGITADAAYSDATVTIIG